MIDKVSPLFLLWNELESKGVFLYKFSPEMDMLIILSQLNENQCGKGPHWYYDIALLNTSVFWVQ